MCLSYEIQWVFPQEGKVLHGPTEFTSALITPPPGCRSHGNASCRTGTVDSRLELSAPCAYKHHLLNNNNQ